MEDGRGLVLVAKKRTFALEVLLVYTQLFGNTGHFFSVVYGKDAKIKIHFDKREGMNLLRETFQCF